MCPLFKINDQMLFITKIRNLNNQMLFNAKIRNNLI
jgi:hypothetical protein